MMNWENLRKEIKVLVEPIIERNGLTLYSINKINDFGGPGIEILVNSAKKIAKTLDFEILSRLNETMSEVLDEKLKLSDQYYLIVGTKGIENEITSENELIKALNKFVAIDLKLKDSDKKQHFEGFLRDYDANTKLYLFEYLNKGQKRKITFTWDQIHKIRHAVKV